MKKKPKAVEKFYRPHIWKVTSIKNFERTLKIQPLEIKQLSLQKEQRLLTDTLSKNRYRWLMESTWKDVQQHRSLGKWNLQSQ